MDKLKYQLDFLSAVNEKLCDSDRMYKMIALSSGYVYYYRNFRHGISELIGPWEKFCEEKPSPERFDENELRELFSEEDAYSFTESIIGMEAEKVTHSEITVHLKKNGMTCKCRGTVYYDEKGEPTDKLIGLEGAIVS